MATEIHNFCFLSFVSCTNSHLRSLCLNECHCFVSNRSPSHSFFLLYKVPKVKQHGHYVLSVSFMCRKNEPFTNIRDGYTHRNSHTMVLCLTNGFSKPNLKAESDVITDIRVQIDLTYTFFLSFMAKNPPWEYSVITVCVLYPLFLTRSQITHYNMNRGS